MIFGVLNSEQIWHQQLVHLPSCWKWVLDFPR